jgi:hypothetical protein
MQYSIEFHSPLSDMLKYGKQRKHFFLISDTNYNQVYCGYNLTIVVVVLRSMLAPVLIYIININI